MAAVIVLRWRHLAYISRECHIVQKQTKFKTKSKSSTGIPSSWMKYLSNCIILNVAVLWYKELRFLAVWCSLCTSSDRTWIRELHYFSFSLPFLFLPCLCRDLFFPSFARSVGVSGCKLKEKKNHIIITVCFVTQTLRWSGYRRWMMSNICRRGQPQFSLPEPGLCVSRLSVQLSVPFSPCLGHDAWLREESIMCNLIWIKRRIQTLLCLCLLYGRKDIFI